MKTTDFAIFMWAESLAMVVPLPGEEHRIFAFVHPFQSTVIIHFVVRSVCQRYELFFIHVTQVWLLIFIAGFTIVVFMTIFSAIYCNFFSSPETSVCITRKCMMNGWFTYYLMYIINTMTNQGKKR
jgi:hypothetical protein